MNKEHVLQLTIDCINEVVQNRDDNPVQEIKESTDLIGPNAVLDSLGLVMLLADLEEKVDETFNLSVILADEKAVSQVNSPFKTVETLSQYLWDRVAEAKDNG